MASPASIRFSQSFRTSLWVVSEALFAGENGPPPHERLQFLVDDMQHYLRHSGFRTRTMVRVSMLLIDLVVPILTLRRPLRWLSWPERVAALATIERSAAGLLVLFVKVLLCLVYYEHPDAEQELMQGHPACSRPVT
jgi:hypothetical protein